MKLNSKSINYNVDTVEGLPDIIAPLVGDTVVVTDENRGGVFVYRADGTANNGTIFASSSTGKWHRQYEGAVNVKWFGVTGLSDETTKIQTAINVAENEGIDTVLLPSKIEITAITVPDNVSLLGVASGTEIYCNNTTGTTNIYFDVNSGVDLERSLSNCMLIAKSNGGVAIKTASGAGVAYTNRPRYSFENLLFKGITLGTSGSLWQYEEGWDIYISIGDCFSTKIDKINLYGTYDITIDQSLSPIGIGIYLDGYSSVRAVRITNYQTSDCKVPIQINENVTSWYLNGFDFSRSYIGINSSYATTSAEMSVSEGYINAQLKGIKVYGRSWSFIDNVNVTRHADGFDHSQEWVGIDLGGDFNDGNLTNIRVLDAGTWVNVGTRIGIRLDDTLRTKFNNITLDASNGNLDFGFYLTNTSTDNVFDNIIFDDVDTWWYFGTGTSDISIGNQEGRGTYTLKYNIGSITTTTFNNNFYIKGVHVKSETENAALESINRFTRSTGFEWQIKQATNDEIVVRDVTNGYNRIEISDINAVNGLVKFGGRIRPLVDNTFTNGDASYRWSTIYAGTGTINTSDAREKTFSDIPEIEMQVAKELKSLVRRFKFNDAIAEKGEDKARIHYGTSAQEVAAVFEKYGLDAMEYAMVCYDEWEEEPEVKDEEGNITQEYRPAGNRYGIRYEELIMFILGAM